MSLGVDAPGGAWLYPIQGRRAVHMAWHAESRWITVDGRRTHVVDAGRGPPLLFLHGFLHSSWTWRAALEALSATHRVIAPCLPGFGWSDAEAGDVSLPALVRWLEALLDELRVPRLAGAIGNSLGGGLCLALAHHAPQRVERLVLVSALGAWLPVPSLPLRLLGVRALGPLYGATAGRAAFVRRLLQLTAYRLRTVDEEVLRGFAHLSRPGGHAAAVAHASALGPSSRELVRLVPTVRTPSLVVWGAEDRLLPLGYGRKVAARLPDARLEVLPGCGHCAQEEEPERFLQLLRAFLPAAASAGGAPPAGPPELIAAR